MLKMAKLVEKTKNGKAGPILLPCSDEKWRKNKGGEEYETVFGLQQ